MVSAINLIPLIIIINPIRPALVVPKLVKIVRNLPNADFIIIHYHLNYLNKKLELKKLLPSEVFCNIIEIQIRLQKNRNNNREESLNKNCHV